MCSKILLHACCGVCALEPVRIFQEEKRNFAVAYINPNIHPRIEFQKRLDALNEYVIKPNNLKLYVHKYNTDEWFKKVPPLKNQLQNRCKQCYRIRFRDLALLAVREGFDTICTTLTISPFQFKEIIFEEIDIAAKAKGIKAELIDFSPYYQRSQEISRNNGMYRQNYCGCSFSCAEAQAQRQKRKEMRKAEKIRKRKLREQQNHNQN